jgi:hypothetical protein
MELIRFIERHEPVLFTELGRRRIASEPESRESVDSKELGFWLDHSLPLLGKYGPRAGDQPLIDLFRYFHDIGVLLRDKVVGLSYYYLTSNPLDVRIGSQVDPAFYATADRLLASVLFSAVERPKQDTGDSEELLAAVIRRAVEPSTANDGSFDPEAMGQTKSWQYLAILRETLRSEHEKAGAILRHLLTVTPIQPAVSGYVVADAPNASPSSGRTH